MPVPCHLRTLPGLCLFVAALPAAEPGPRLDRHGDPLPPGAVARLGTTRLRPGGLHTMALSPDGRTLATGEYQTLRLWDLSDGRELRSIPLPGVYTVATIRFSPDGRLVTAKGSRVPLLSPGWESVDDGIYVCDVTGGKVLHEFGRDRIGLAFGETDNDLLRWLRRRGHRYESVGFARGGRVLLAQEREPFDSNDLILWDTATGKESRRLSNVLCCAVSPDGNTIAGGRQDGGIILWDAATGREVRRLKGHPLPVRALAFSADGKMLVSGGGREAEPRLTARPVGEDAGAKDEAVLQLWETATSKERGKFTEQAKPIVCLRFSPDGRILLAGEQDRALLLWDVAKGKVRHRLEGGSRGERSFAFDPDSKSLFWCARDRTVHRWDLAADKDVRQRQEGGLEELAVTTDGKTLVTLGDRLVVRDLTTGKERFSHEAHRLPILRLQFSPDGKAVASFDTGRTLRVWEADTGKPRRLGEGFRIDGVLRFVFSADGRTLTTVGLDAFVRAWNLRDGREVRSFSLGRDQRDHWRRAAPLWGEAYLPEDLVAVFAPGNRVLAVETEDGPVRLWDVASGKELVPVREGRKSLLYRRMGFSPDGHRLALVSAGSSLTVWGVTSGERIVEYKSDPKDFTRFTFSPDGRLLAHTNGDKVRLLDLEKGKEVRQFDGHEGGADVLAFEDGGRALVTGSSRDHTVRVWDVATGRELNRMTGDERWPFHAMRLRTTGGGRVLAAIALDGKNSRWTIREPITGRTVGAMGFGETFDVSPDGRTLATWGYLRHEVTLIDTATGEELGRLAGHRGEVTAVAFSPDGRRIATGGADTSILVWDWRDACGLTPEVRGRVGPRELEAWWTDLASEDAARAERATAALAAGKDGVNFLRARIRPVTASERGAWRRLVADLDSDEFEVRERASAALAALGADAVPFLRRTLAGDLSPEARRRLDEVLQDARLTRWSDAALRCLRAVAALEWNDAPEAARLLGALARGEAGERLTQEAKAALRRRAALGASSGSEAGQ